MIILVPGETITLTTSTGTVLVDATYADRSGATFLEGNQRTSVTGTSTVVDAPNSGARMVKNLYIKPSVTATITVTVDGAALISKSVDGGATVDLLLDAAFTLLSISQVSGLQTALDSKADDCEVKSSNFTAVVHGSYVAVATLTVTDPTPDEGHGFRVIVRNGTATVGGVAYIQGQIIDRIFHSGSWSNTVSATLATAQTFSALQTFSNGLTVSAGTTSLVGTLTPLGLVLMGALAGKRIEFTPASGLVEFFDRGTSLYHAARYLASSHSFEQGGVTCTTLTASGGAIYSNGASGSTIYLQYNGANQGYILGRNGSAVIATDGSKPLDIEIAGTQRGQFSTTGLLVTGVVSSTANLNGLGVAVSAPSATTGDYRALGRTAASAIMLRSYSGNEGGNGNLILATADNVGIYPCLTIQGGSGPYALIEGNGPGTPGSTQVLIGGGQIKAGSTITALGAISAGGGYVGAGGDIGAARTASTGAYYFGQSSARFIYHDGSKLESSHPLFVSTAAPSSTLTGNTVAQVITWLQTIFA